MPVNMHQILKKPLLVIVLLFIALMTYYWTFIVSERYVVESEFKILVQQAPSIDILGQLTGGAGGSASDDAYILRHFILSREFLERVKDNINFRKVYSCKIADSFTCMADDLSIEEQVKYLKKRISVEVDTLSGIIQLKVQAYKAEDALKLSEEVLQASEKLVNELSDKANFDGLIFARKERDRAEEKLLEIQKKITSFRSKKDSLDPQSTAQARLGIIAEIELQIAKAEAELSSMRSFMQPQAPAVVAKRNHVIALKKQLAKQNAGIVGARKKERRLSTSISEYESLLLERELAQKAYASALASMEQARIESLKQQRYLVRIVNPYLPDEAIYPNRAFEIFKSIVGILLIYGILALIWAAIKDHAGWV